MWGMMRVRAILIRREDVLYLFCMIIKNIGYISSDAVSVTQITPTFVVTHLSSASS